MWIALALALLTIATYWPVLDHDFVRYDDPDYVTGNARVLAGVTWSGLKWALTAGFAGNWHPLTWISHMLDVEWFGAYPGGHHLTSMLLHAANTVLLFLLLRWITGSPWRSAFVAALFALHPLHVESVAWVAERKDVLSAFFFMLTLLVYARFVALKSPWSGPLPPGPSRSRALAYGASLALFALGLMSKPMLVTVPFVLLLLDVWPFNRLARGESYRGLFIEKIPFFLLSIVCSIVTFMVQEKTHAVHLFLPLSRRLLNAVVSYCKYIGKTLCPVDLAVFYPHPDAAYPTSDQWPLGAILAAMLVLVAVTVFALTRYRRTPWLCVGWLWFLGMLVPVIGIVQVGSQAMADRYTYLPLVGLFLIAAWGIPALLPAARLAMPVLLSGSALVIVGAIIATRAQLAHWQNNFTLFTHAVAVTKKNAVAYAHLGVEFGRQGEYPQAFEQFKLGLKANPSSPDAHYGMGYTLQQLGQREAALREYRETLQLSPWHSLAHRRLAELLWAGGDQAEALRHFEQATELTPEDAEARLEFARALLNSGSVARGQEQLELAVAQAPQFREALQALGELLLRQGRIAEAEVMFRRVVEVDPQSVEAHVNLGGVLWQRGQRTEALKQYAEAVKLNPEHPVAQFNLGTALVAQGKLAEGCDRFAEAVRLKPDYAEALIGWGQALSVLGRSEDAVVPLEKAAQLHPTNANLQVNVGNALIMAGQTNRAEQFFVKARQLEPELARKLLVTAQALLGQGQTNAAMGRLIVASRLAPENADILRLLEDLRQATNSNGNHSGK